MLIRFVILSLVLSVSVVAAQKPPSLEAQFQAAIHKETVAGDLKTAMTDYRRIADEAKSTDRRLAAQALLRLAGCHEKLGGANAASVHEEIVRQFADQPDAVSTSRAYLARLKGSAQRSTALSTERSLWAGNDVPLEAAITPDARLLVYADASKNGNLSIREVETGTVRALTTSGDWSAAQPQQAGAVTISRDGKQLAYAWLVTSTVDGRDVPHWELRVREVAGATPADGRRLYRHDDNMWFAPVAWTPDGQRIVVAMSRPDRTRQIATVAIRDGSLRVLKTLNWRGSGGHAVSPDGRWIAFDMPANEETSQRDIFALAIDGSSEVRVVQGASRDSVVTWTKDGRYLIFESDRRGPTSLWAQPMNGARAAGEPVLLLAQSRGTTLAVAWDTGALCQLVMTDNRTIYTTPVDLASGRRLGPASAPLRTSWPEVSQPRFSPDGLSLAFGTQRMPNVAPDGFISVQTLSTGKVLEVPVKLTYMWEYDWTPDSNGFVMRGTDYKGRHGIFKADLNGDVTPIALAREGERFVAPRLATMGTSAMYVRAGSGPALPTAVIHDLPSGEKREIPLAYPGRIVGFSPDGGTVAGMQSTADATYLWITTMSEGKGRRIVEVKGRNAVRGVQWQPDGRGLIYTTGNNGRDGGMRAWTVSLDAPNPVRLELDAPKMIGTDLAVSPDGKTVAFRAGDPLKFEIRLLENYLPAGQSSSRANENRR